MFDNTNTNILEIITGCMFSGKSTELIKRMNRHKLLGRKVLSVTHKCDKRYSNDDDIVTHDKVSTSAIGVDKLGDLDIKEADVVCVEEAQFFADLYSAVKTWLSTVYKQPKIIIVCGLDGDYKAEPFMDLLKLIPLADRIVKLHALCMDCCDGTPANFSKRITNALPDDNRLLVGSSDSYRSVCRKHFR